jgi:hypothetical protein
LFTRRPLRSALLALALCVVSSAASAADSATVVFAGGDVSLTSKDGKARPVTRGQGVRPGHLVRTGAGQVQLRFRDGTFVSVYAGSDLRIDDYRYQPRAAGGGTAAFTLYRGGVRFMTGEIAASSGNRFHVSTPSGTLRAVRSEFAAAAGAGLQISVGAGSVEIRNEAGVMQLAAGQRAFVRDRHTPAIAIGTIVPAPVTPQ